MLCHLKDEAYKSLGLDPQKCDLKCFFALKIPNVLMCTLQ